MKTPDAGGTGAQAPIVTPDGYTAGGSDWTAIGDGGGHVLTYGFSTPGDPEKGIVGSVINVAVFPDSPAYSKGTSEMDTAAALTGRDGFQAMSLGGRDVARLQPYETVSGKEFGLPDRVSSMYVFRDDGYIVEVIAEVPDEAVIGAMIKTYEPAAARAAVAAKVGAS